MTDRQLLEDAARAAGIAVEFSIFSDGSFLCFKEGGDCFSDEWSPLTDDGDALRIAVKLGIDVVTGGGRTIAYCQGLQVGEYHGDDPYAATRRAITRAAAEIGRK